MPESYECSLEYAIMNENIVFRREELIRCVVLRTVRLNVMILTH